jgi:glycosyltransferase involved in cell wall biosynthesis
MRHIDRHAANILIPYWEIDYVDPRWIESISFFKEIWAPTVYIAKMLEGRVSQPIARINQPVLIPENASDASILKGPLKLLTFFDVDSFPQRKNPGAAVTAFKQALPIPDQSARLTIKLRGNNDRGFRKWLHEIVIQDPRITVIDKTLPRAEMDALISNCHVFLSLHRAEGFGFGAAEAMAAGKAVIATDYSGTKDFVTARTGYPVPYTLHPLKPDDYLCYAPGQQWAWPNVNAAAEILRRIERNRFEAKIIGAAGRKFMIDNYGLKAVGETMRSRLLEISGENV